MTLSCSDREDNNVNTIKKNEDMMKLSELHSGYNLSADDWKSFLNCWHEKKKLINNSDDTGSFINFSNSNALTIGREYDESIIEKKIKAKLSQSIHDFYNMYSTLGGVYLDVDDLDSIGMLAPTSIIELKNYAPWLIQLDHEWAIESSDEDYYRYGIEQDDSSGRTSYMSTALVLGKFGLSEYELILAYPNSRTKDGEMEIAILSHAYEFRTPSFAEMMRQVGVLNIENRESMPPYMQEEINESCADYLHLDNIWWK